MTEKIISTNYMNKGDLSKLTKSQLIDILLKQDSEINKCQLKHTKQQPKNDNIILPPKEFRDDYKPVPLPRKSVKQMVQEYEDNIILPPSEFRDDNEYKTILPPKEFGDKYRTTLNHQYQKNQHQNQGLKNQHHY